MPVQRNPYRPKEGDEQIAVIMWAELLSGRVPELKKLYHIPNGGERNKAEAARFKAMGVRKGFPDLALPVARGGFHGLYIELKTTGGKASKEQLGWIDALNAEGNCALICVGADEAIHTITQYLNSKILKQ